MRVPPARLVDHRPDRAEPARGQAGNDEDSSTSPASRGVTRMRRTLPRGSVRRYVQVGCTDAVTARSVGDQRSSSLGFVAP